MPALQTDRLLHDLSDLWVSLGKQEQKPGETSHGVLRACMMTLIVATEGTGDEQALGETLAELMRVHPSRAVVLRVLDSPEPHLDARVFAQCWMPFGKRQQICCEQIEISSTAGNLADVYPVVLGITAPDLPVMLWLRSPHLLFVPEFESILPLARSLVLDSGIFEDAGPILTRIQQLHAGGWRIKDLGWTRITPWREAVAQTFECEGTIPILPKISEITISHTAAQPSLESLYLASWLLARMPNAAVKFQPAATVMPGDVQGLMLKAPEWEAVLTATAASMLELRVNSMSNLMVFPEPSQYALLQEELAILGRDPVYQTVLAGAAKLASE